MGPHYRPTFVQEGNLVHIFANNQNERTCGGLLPGIENFQIIGQARPGSMLQACGFSVHGTSHCFFQWVRQLQNGSRQLIEGATKPDYVVTADDVDNLIAVECIPMDDSGLQGNLVKIFANNQNKITCDREMQQEIESRISAGQATFNDVHLTLNATETAVEHSLASTSHANALAAWLVIFTMICIIVVVVIRVT